MRRHSRASLSTALGLLLSACVAPGDAGDAGVTTDCLPLPAFADVVACNGPLTIGCAGAHLSPTGHDDDDYFAPTLIAADLREGYARVEGVTMFSAGTHDGVPAGGYDYPTWTTAARVTYLVRLNASVPMATLVRAEPIALELATAEYEAARVERDGRARLACERVGDWDVWAVPANIHLRGGHVSTEIPATPNSFQALVLVERGTGRVWASSIPLLPASCADAWRGTDVGAACEPTLGIAPDDGIAPNQAFAFVAREWLVDTHDFTADELAWRTGTVFSCPVQAVCCLGLLPEGTGGFCPQAVESSWLDAACAATSLDQIPGPASPPPCNQPVAACSDPLPDPGPVCL